MHIRSKLIAGALVALMTTGSGLAYAAAAADTAKTPAAPTEAKAKADYPTQSGMLEVADGATQALMDIHAARVALMDGETETAGKLIASAKTAFDESHDEWAALTVGDTQNKDSDLRFLPVNASMALGETFVMTPEAGDALKTAGAQMQKGDKDQALETLRVADVQLEMTVAMLPLNGVDAALATAGKSVTDGDYYAANLALKGVLDSVEIRSYGVDAIPVQGDGQKHAAAETAPAAQKTAAAAPAATPKTATN